MTDMAAAIGIEQMKRFAQFQKRRNEIWSLYNSAFRDLPITLPPADDKDKVHARHLYTIMVDKKVAGLSRDELMRNLHEMNIGTGIHFISLHLHDYYRRTFGLSSGDFPQALYASKRILSLPLSPKMSDKDVRDVISSLRQCLGGK